jgi:predicted O-methyltransferase YrrM
LADELAALEGVEGWLAAREALALHRAARDFPVDGPVRVVEIGSWKGRSTIALATGVAARRAGGVVHAIDPHRGGVLHRLTGEADSYGAFVANVERAGVRDVVDPIRTTSAEARSRIPDDSVHVLFVDGSHRYDDVLRDLEAWTPALRAGARVAFHDAISFPGVAAVLRERVLTRGSPFRSPVLWQETLHVIYDPGDPWRAEDARRALAMRARLASARAARHVKSTVRRAVGRPASGPAAEARVAGRGK